MYMVAIETTGAFASVALTDGETILAHIEGNDRFSHLQNLMPQMQQVLAEAGLQIGDVNGIAVSAGPGSFTGIRIGVSSARALSQVLDIPCVAVSSLEALAMRAGGVAAETDIICPMLDARRGQVYAGAYRLEHGYPVPVIEAAPAMAAAFLEAAKEKGHLYLMGDGVDVYGKLIREIPGLAFNEAPESIRYQHAETVAMLGAKHFAEGKIVAYEALQPEYMRIPEAERKLQQARAAKETNHA